MVAAFIVRGQLHRHEPAWRARPAHPRSAVLGQHGRFVVSSELVGSRFGRYASCVVVVPPPVCPLPLSIRQNGIDRRCVVLCVVGAIEPTKLIKPPIYREAYLSISLACARAPSLPPITIHPYHRVIYLSYYVRESNQSAIINRDIASTFIDHLLVFVLALVLIEVD